MLGLKLRLRARSPMLRIPNPNSRWESFPSPPDETLTAFTRFWADKSPIPLEKGASELLRLESVQIRRRGNEVILQEKLDNGGPQAFNVHGVSCSEVDEISPHRGRTGGISTPADNRQFPSPSLTVSLPQTGQWSGMK